MKRLSLVLICLATLMGGSTVNANLVSITYTNDNDGAINCNWGYQEYGGATNYAEVDIAGDIFWGPGHMLGTIVTDSAEDPSLRFRTTIDNGTGFDWTSYDVNVFMSQPYYITNVMLYDPSSGWGTYYTETPTWNGSMYQGLINFYVTTGDPISGDTETPGTLDFSYKIVFSGSTTYTFTQEMIPVPEPGTLGLFAMGGLLAGFINRRLRR